MRNHQLLFALDLQPSSGICAFGIGTDQTSNFYFFFSHHTWGSAEFFHIPLVVSFPHWTILVCLVPCQLASKPSQFAGCPLWGKGCKNACCVLGHHQKTFSIPFPGTLAMGRSKECGKADRDQGNGHLKITHKHRPSTVWFKVLSSSSLSCHILFSLRSDKPAGWSLTQVLKVRFRLTLYDAVKAISPFMRTTVYRLLGLCYNCQSWNLPTCLWLVNHTVIHWEQSQTPVVKTPKTPLLI